MIFEAEGSFTPLRETGGRRFNPNSLIITIMWLYHKESSTLRVTFPYRGTLPIVIPPPYIHRGAIFLNKECKIYLVQLSK